MSKKYKAQVFVNFRCPECKLVMQNYKEYMQCENVHCNCYLAKWAIPEFEITPYSEIEEA